MAKGVICDPTFSVEQLKAEVHYDSDTGIFTRLVSRGNVRAGDVAGQTTSCGYRQLRILGRLVTAHRAAWFYMTGAWPDDCIDHINGQKSDNRFDNLRQAARWQNGCNVRANSKNTSGYRGVYFRRSKGTWVAMCCVNGRKFLGDFSTREEAHAAHDAYYKSLAGEFVREDAECRQSHSQHHPRPAVVRGRAPVVS